MQLFAARSTTNIHNNDGWSADGPQLAVITFWRGMGVGYSPPQNVVNTTQNVVLTTGELKGCDLVQFGRQAPTFRRNFVS